MISAGTSSARSAVAIAIASPVLPVAVAPAIASSGGAAALSVVGMPADCLTIPVPGGAR